jgi:hypothetical protein
MNAADSSGEHPKKSRKRLLAAVIAIVVILSAVTEFYVYEVYYNPCNSWPGCGPVDEPQILAGTNVATSYGEPVCAVVTEGFQGVTCEAFISAGTTGVITMNMTSLGGDSYVQFANYSSNPYVRFTSTPQCPLSSIENYTAPRCTVSGNGSTFRFGYSVAQNLAAPQQVAILTVTVTKVCCWP